MKIHFSGYSDDCIEINYNGPCWIKLIGPLGDGLMVYAHYAPEHIECALEALREKQDRENPKPLTLEQLKERVGKPVYIMWRPDENWHFAESGWVVVELDGEFIDGYSFKNYGKTWLAYDHEPKEAHK